MTPTLTHYESRFAHTVHVGGIRVGTVEVTKRHDGRGRTVAVRGWCDECCCEVDAQGQLVADDDRSGARYHATLEGCTEAVGRHALQCDDMIAEMSRHARTVAA